MSIKNRREKTEKKVEVITKRNTKKIRMKQTKERIKNSDMS